MLSNMMRSGAMAAFLLTATVATAAEPVQVASNQFRAKQVLGTKIMITGNTAEGVRSRVVRHRLGEERHRRGEDAADAEAGE